MKKLIFSGIIAIAGITFFSCNKNENKGTVASECIPANLSNGILAFYSFSNGSTNDFSGNNYDLLSINGAQSAADRSGNPNCAFSFSRNSYQYLTTANTSFLNNLTQFSISLWYEPTDSTRGGADFETLVSRDSMRSCPDRGGQWSVALYDCRHAVFAAQNSVWDMDILPVGSSGGCAAEIAVRTGNWHHLTATYDNANNEMKIYRDGILQGTHPLVSSCGAGNPIQNLGDLFLGLNYTGKLDDVIIYNRTLNQSEVTQLSQMLTCCASN